MREMNDAKRLLTVVAMLASLAPCACEWDDRPSCDGDPVAITRPDFWEVGSHCRGVQPDYGRVFDDTRVHRFDITIDPGTWEAMDDDLNWLTFEMSRPPDLDAMDDPIWMPVDVRYDGGLWTDVGMRWKGHSSLLGAVSGAIHKLSFLLTFDYFEEAYPEILDQRFFGFKKLIFANGYLDQSFIHEKVASEIFRAAGIPVYRTAFTEVYVDLGDGPEYLGLYTFMEDPSDKMLEAQFGTYYDNDGNDLVGNLYKPWGDAARWRDPEEAPVTEIEVDVEVEGDAGLAGTGTVEVPENAGWWEEDIETHFEKCTNEESSDWSDVMKVIDKLHRDRDVPEQWRADLEESFDAQSFLRTLALNATIVAWDSYGCMHHNYYVYANPLDRGRLTWLPWDLGETLNTDTQDPDCPDVDGVMFDEIVNADGDTWDEDPASYWPLIRYLLSDAKYRQDYRDALRELLDGPFARDRVFSLIDGYHALVAPYVVGPAAIEEDHRVGPYWWTTCDQGDCSEFEDESVDEMKAHVEARRAAVEAALAAE